MRNCKGCSGTGNTAEERIALADCEFNKRGICTYGEWSEEKDDSCSVINRSLTKKEIKTECDIYEKKVIKNAKTR